MTSIKINTSFKWAGNNSKLIALGESINARVVGFDLPAGYTCPNSDICRTFANPKTGKLIKAGQFVCYAAKVEIYAPSARRARWNNYNLLRELSPEKSVNFLIQDLKRISPDVVRVHTSGDFFNNTYLEVWREVASHYPYAIFFGYTKVIEAVKPLSNWHFVYSHGGKRDQIAHDKNLPTCYVETSPEQYPDIQQACLTPNDDYFFILHGESFKIKLH